MSHSALRRRAQQKARTARIHREQARIARSFTTPLCDMLRQRVAEGAPREGLAAYIIDTAQPIYRDLPDVAPGELHTGALDGVAEDDPAAVTLGCGVMPVAALVAILEKHDGAAFAARLAAPMDEGIPCVVITDDTANLFGVVPER